MIGSIEILLNSYLLIQLINKKRPDFPSAFVVVFFVFEKVHSELDMFFLILKKKKKSTYGEKPLLVSEILRILDSSLISANDKIEPFLSIIDLLTFVGLGIGLFITIFDNIGFI